MRKQMVNSTLVAPSLRRQCELLNINRSSLYYSNRPRLIDEVTLMNLIRDTWLAHPFYGYRKITATLNHSGVSVNRKRIQRLMRQMGLKGLQRTRRSPNTSKGNAGHKKYPYRLGECSIIASNGAWMVDITYLRLGAGFMYLVALIDVHSRYVVGWTLSNSLETEPCLASLNRALNTYCAPDIINSDQGCQFTSAAWVSALDEANITVSMTGKGRCLDNVYIERFWRSLKHEEVYLNDYDNVDELAQAIGTYIEFYNTQRPHQSLNYKTPEAIYFAIGKINASQNQLLPLAA